MYALCKLIAKALPKAHPQEGFCLVSFGNLDGAFITIANLACRQGKATAFLGGLSPGLTLITGGLTLVMAGQKWENFPWGTISGEPGLTW